MNTKALYGLGILVAIVSSCSSVEQDTKEEILFTKEQQEVIITAAVESGPETRTVLNSNNLSVLWKPSDEIKVFSAGEASKFISQNSENQKAVNFLGTISVITGTAEGADIDTHIYGLYPYTDEATMTDGSFTTTLPFIQTGLAETFDDDLFISIGRSYTFSMGFWNVCSGYRFSFTEGGYQSVTLTSNDGTPLAGTFITTFDDNGKPVITSTPMPSASVTVNAPEGGFSADTWYYLIVLPGTHASGLTFTATNESGTGTYVIDEEKTFNRSKFKQIAGLDQQLSRPQTNKEIWYTSSNNEIVIPKYDDVFGATLLSNTFENGKGIMTFDSDVTSIGRGAFSGCSTLTSLSIPESVISLGNAAFSGTMISEIVLPSKITVLPDAAFYDCSALANVVLPEGLVSISTNAFANCVALSGITLPTNLETLGIGVFSGSGLTSITLPNSIISIGGNCFMGCSSLQTVNLPSGLSTIPSSAFRGCSQLSSVDMPNSLSVIESGAFWQCSSLPSVFTIPSSVSRINDKAFYGCTSIEKMYILRESGATVEKDAFLDCPCYNNKRIFVPASALSKYITNSLSMSFLNIGYICAIEAEGIEPVDLGLSVKWAPFNIGGSETTRGTRYTNIDGDIVISSWGGKWRLPTNAEWEELNSSCTWEESEIRVNQSGYSSIPAYRITGSNSQSIYLVADRDEWEDGGYYNLCQYYTSSTTAFFFLDMYDESFSGHPTCFRLGNPYFYESYARAVLAE